MPEVEVPGSGLLFWIVFLPLFGAITNGLFYGKLGKRMVTFVGVGTVAVSFALAVWAVILLNTQDSEHPRIAADLWSWIASGYVDIKLALLLDPLSTVMLLVVTGVGGLIHVFSIGYMWDDEAYGRYFAYLNLFMFSMLLLILGKNMLVLFVGWEGVGLCSYLLIGFWYQDMEKAIAGKKAFIANRIGDFAFLIGMFILLYYTQGDLDFDRLSLLQSAGQHPTISPADVTVVCILFLIGATGKSAQIPLYVWLPDAMAGPTPVSALIHAATMVTAGVYMMARLNFLYLQSEVAMATVAIIGAATALFAATIALTQNDIKKVLAYSTVSQIGFMVLAVGVGNFVGAIFHLMAHAFFKACLFLGSGSVIHGLHHEQDIRKMGGLKAKFPVTSKTFFIACLAIAGIFPFAGFFSKDEILFNTFTTTFGHSSPHYILWGVATLAAFFTSFYMFRLYYLTFEGEFRGDKHAYDHAHEVGVMNWPLIILAALATVGGFLGIPAAFGHDMHVLDRWFEPVFGAAHETLHYSHEVSMEWILMAVSLGLAVTAWMIARRVYKRPTAELPTVPSGGIKGWAYNKSLNKYFVDELYALIFIRPLISTARFCHRFIDARLIDGVGVNGVARALSWVGNRLRRLQNGDVQAYATVLVVGVALLLVLGLYLGGCA